MLIVQHDDKTLAGTHTHTIAHTHTNTRTTIMPRKGQRLKELSSVDGPGLIWVDEARAVAGREGTREYQ